MSALAALKFFGPHILDIIKDAVKKWNHLVPEGREEEFKGDLQLIVSKLEELPDYEEKIRPTVKNLETKAAHSSVILELGKATRAYLDDKFINICGSYMSALVGRDMEEQMRVTKRIRKLTKQFNVSMEMQEITHMESGSSHESVRLIEDALLALERISPDRKLAPSGTLILRDLVTVNHMSVSKDDLIEMKRKFKSLYHFKVTTCAFGPTSVSLVPQSHYVSGEIISEVYGLELSQMTVRGMTELDKDTLPWFVREDPNISITAIISKVVGSAVTSLSTVVCDFTSWGTQVYYAMHKDIGLQTAMVHLRENPWSHVRDIMLFMSPIELYRSLNVNDVPTARISEDFGTMKKMLELYLIFVSTYSTVNLGQIEPSAPSMTLPSRGGSDRFYPSIRSSSVHNIEIPGPTMEEINTLKNFIQSIFERRGSINFLDEERTALDNSYNAICQMYLRIPRDGRI